LQEVSLFNRNAHETGRHEGTGKCQAILGDKHRESRGLTGVKTDGIHTGIAREAGTKAAIEAHTEGVFSSTCKLEEVRYVRTGLQRVGVSGVSANWFVIQEN
jgi:hypothetical protein